MGLVDAWTALSSWATPTALFLLLNLVIVFIALIASRKTNDPPQPPHHHQIHHESDRPLLRAPSLFSRVTSLDFSHHSDESEHCTTVNDAVPPPITRAPSFLSRMTSFSNFYHHPLHQASAESETHYYTPPPVESEKKPDESVPYASAVSETHYYTPPAESEKKSDESVSYASAEPVSRATSFLSRMTSFSRSTEEKPPEESRPAIERAPSLLSRMASFNFSLRSAEPELETEGAREEHVARSATEPKRKKKAVPGKMKKSSSDKTSETASFGGRHDDGVDAKADDFINKFKQQLRLQRLDSLLRYRSSAGES